MLIPKTYQHQALGTLRRFLSLYAMTKDPGRAFTTAVEETAGVTRSYVPAPGLSEVPYVCVRVPTGGGKTFMAAQAAGIAGTVLFGRGSCLVLWLVPSNAIRTQTLDALKSPHHPYREALEAAYPGRVHVLDIREALYAPQGDLRDRLCVIVATLAALRVTDPDGRKVYEPNGRLMDHFTGIDAELAKDLEAGPGGAPVPSLQNVLRLRQPLILVDEAHNARTPLSFATVHRFAPACLVEFTATPQTRHDPERDLYPSNVLAHVSALELKREGMVKLPLRLHAEPIWQKALLEAVQLRAQLEDAAGAERQSGGPYVRPIVLLQAQPHSADGINLTVERLRDTLVEECSVPPNHIAIATGEIHDLAGVDLLSEACPIRFVITVQALREGWDCPFAYVLYTATTVATATATEQILGRILRQPHAQLMANPSLNESYAIATQDGFQAAADALCDALVQSGFERYEARLSVVAARPRSLPGLLGQHAVTLSAAPDRTGWPDALHERVRYEPEGRTLTVLAGLSEHEERAVYAALQNDQDHRAVEALLEGLGQPEEVGPRPAPLLVPVLTVRRDGRRSIFDETHLLAPGLDLAGRAGALDEQTFPDRVRSGQSGTIDVGERGRVQIDFQAPELERRLSLLDGTPAWTLAKLVNWLDRQIPHPELARAQSTLFLSRILESTMQERGLPVERLVQDRFRLRAVLQDRLDGERSEARRRAWETSLFGPEAAVEVDAELAWTFRAETYALRSEYAGRYRFGKHVAPVIGDLDDQALNGEEVACAALIDGLDEVDVWVRNLSGQPRTSFWLQTSTDKFYPDFLTRLKDGRILVVEYKGADRYTNDDTKEKRRVGELWAERSHGRCLFAVVTSADMAGTIQRLVAS